MCACVVSGRLKSVHEVQKAVFSVDDDEDVLGGAVGNDNEAGTQVAATGPQPPPKEENKEKKGMIGKLTSLFKS
jgi:hypothetical protein